MKVKLYLPLLALLFLINCTQKSDKEYFDKIMLSIKEKKYTEALSEMEKLLEKYPESKLSPQAIYEIAKLYHSNLIPNLGKEESLRKAIDYYKKIFSNYKNFPEAERALFVTGFIFANELNKLDSAKYYYELFLKNFNNSELTNSVKLELENLGKSPEEILTKKMNSNAKKN